MASVCALTWLAWRGFLCHVDVYISIRGSVETATIPPMHTPAPSGEAQYQFMDQLLAVDRCRPGSQCVDSRLTDIVTPVKLETWQTKLAGHPDQRFAHYILAGLQRGFRIGFNHGSASLRQGEGNMKGDNPQAVADYLKAELEANRLSRLSKAEASTIGVHFSPIGVIPKKGKPGKWRLIVNLSAPSGGSVNDGVDKESIRFSYTSVDAIADRVVALGRGSQLAKMDIKQAYRMIPVHPEDRYLLGMLWEGVAYVDKTLPFGLRSAPLIFTAVADALQWMMLRDGASFVDHYVDDFVTVGKPRSDECARNARVMHRTCAAAGAPVEERKSEGPATQITSLGIEIDSIVMEIRLPADKLSNLQAQLAQWRGKKGCTKTELESLVGSLSHACKVVRYGRSFLRRLINLGKLAKKPRHFFRLNREARSDIEWWHQFAATWNGVSMLLPQRQANPDVTVTSDASGKWGCGAFCGACWFQLQWVTGQEQSHITVKELIPIVIAAAVWGRAWSGRSVQAWCDNSAAVAGVNWGDSAAPEVSHLLRCLAFIKAKWQFTLRASHIRGVNNELADALSRNNATSFFANYPQAHPAPTPLPQELLDLLIIAKPDWTQPAWTSLWSATFAAV